MRFILGLLALALFGRILFVFVIPGAIELDAFAEYVIPAAIADYQAEQAEHAT